jgi:protein-arginine kinase
VYVATDRIWGAMSGVEDWLRTNGESFAHSEMLGHIVSSPSKVGSGLQLTVRLSLPLQYHMDGVDALVLRIRDLGLRVSGVTWSFVAHCCGTVA